MNSIRNGGHRRQRPPGERNGRGGSPNQRQRQGSGGAGGRNGGSAGNAQRNYERYIALAREAALSGDTVEMENCYQHAEHYFRVMKEGAT